MVAHNAERSHMQTQYRIAVSVLVKCFVGWVVVMAALAFLLRAHGAEPLKIRNGNLSVVNTNLVLSDFLRTNRLVIKQGAGCVGVRVCGSNSVPAVLMTSINGGPWRLLSPATNGLCLSLPATNRMQLFRLDEITPE